MKKIWKNLLLALSGEEKDFISGDINRAIFLLSVPMILEMAMESLFAIVDIYFVSKVSIDAAATVGMTESVMTLIYSLAWGLSTGASAYIARRIGENKHEEAGHAAAQTILISIAFALVIGVIGAVYAEDLLRLMGGEPQLIEKGTNFTRIMFAGNVVIMLLFSLGGVLRGAGDASTAMRSLWLANGINILLDPVLIFGFGSFEGLGVTGAAIATTTGRGVGVLYQLYMLQKGNGNVGLKASYFKIDWHIIWQILSVSAGSTIQFIISSASWIFLMRIVSTFGSSVVAGYTIAIRIIIFTIMPSWGMANAAGTLVGQNLGANQPERAEESAWKAAFLNMIFLVFVGIVFFFFADRFVGFFNEDPQVVATGVQCLQIFCFGYLFFGYGMVLSQAFNGSGDTFTPTVVNIVCFWLLEIPLAYLLAISFDWGPKGCYWSVAISESTLALIFIWLFRKGKWKTVKI